MACLRRVPRHVCVCVPPPSPLLAASAGSSGPRRGGRFGAGQAVSGCGCGCGERHERRGPEHWLTGGRDEGGTGVRRRVPEFVCVEERRSMCADVRLCVCVYLRECCWRVLDRSFAAASPLHRPIHPSLHNARRRSGRPGFYRKGSAKDPDSSSFHARQTGKSGTGGSKTPKGSVAVMLLPLPLSGRPEINHGMGMSVGGVGGVLCFPHPPHPWPIRPRPRYGGSRASTSRGGGTVARLGRKTSRRRRSWRHRDVTMFHSRPVPDRPGSTSETGKKSRALGLFPPTIHNPQVPQSNPPVRRAMALCVPPCMSSARGCRLGRSGVLHPRRHCWQSGGHDLLVPRRRNGYTIGVHWCIRDSMPVRHQPAGKGTTHTKK